MRAPDTNGATRPQACPFVAFDDDRDRRSEAPDARHRCFAVPNPEPRAIAHQQAYCLTPNFPSCAFFMDWAARAAAAPLAGSGAGFGAPPAAGGGYPAYGAYSGQAAAVESPGAADPVGRAWAAPPPWVGDPDMRATQQPTPQPWAPPPPASLAPQAWTPEPPPAPIPAQPEQLAALPEAEESEADRDYDLSGDAPLAGAATSGPPPARPDPAILPVPSEAYPEEEPIAVDRHPTLAPLPPTLPGAWTVPLPAAPGPSVVPSTPGPVPPPGQAALPTIASTPSPAFGQMTDEPVAYAPSGPEAWSHPVDLYGAISDDIETGSQPPRDEGRSRLSGRPIDAGGPARFTPQARQPLKKKSDGEWSKPRRFEAYPALTGRLRLGRLSPVLVAAFAVAIVALLLFLLPGLLGGGAPAPTRTPAAATATVVPTATPKPTPQNYTVKSGDILGAVAKSLGRTVEQIACFNNLKNVNSLSIGQVLLIPPPDYACPAKPTPTKK